MEPSGLNRSWVVPSSDLPAGDHRGQEPPTAVHRVVDLGDQPATRAADAMTCRFTVSAERAVDEAVTGILVIRFRPLCPAPGAWCSCRAGGPG